MDDHDREFHEDDNSRREDRYWPLFVAAFAGPVALAFSLYPLGLVVGIHVLPTLTGMLETPWRILAVALTGEMSVLDPASPVYDRFTLRPPLVLREEIAAMSAVLVGLGSVQLLAGKYRYRPAFEHGLSAAALLAIVAAGIFLLLKTM